MRDHIIPGASHGAGLLHIFGWRCHGASGRRHLQWKPYGLTPCDSPTSERNFFAFDPGPPGGTLSSRVWYPFLVVSRVRWWSYQVACSCRGSPQKGGIPCAMGVQSQPPVKDQPGEQGVWTKGIQAGRAQAERRREMALGLRSLSDQSLCRSCHTRTLYKNSIPYRGGQELRPLVWSRAGWQRSRSVSSCGAGYWGRCLSRPVSR